jgi:hypothetical protein
MQFKQTCTCTCKYRESFTTLSDDKPYKLLYVMPCHMEKVERMNSISEPNTAETREIHSFQCVETQWANDT